MEKIIELLKWADECELLYEVIDSALNGLGLDISDTNINYQYDAYQAAEELKSLNLEDDDLLVAIKYGLDEWDC